MFLGKIKKKIGSSFTINLHKTVEMVLLMLNFYVILFVILCMYFAEHNHGYPTILTIIVHPLRTGPCRLRHQNDTAAKEESARSFPVHF